MYEIIEDLLSDQIIPSPNKNQFVLMVNIILPSNYNMEPIWASQLAHMTLNQGEVMGFSPTYRKQVEIVQWWKIRCEFTIVSLSELYQLVLSLVIKKIQKKITTYEQLINTSFSETQCSQKKKNLVSISIQHLVYKDDVCTNRILLREMFKR